MSKPPEWQLMNEDFIMNEFPRTGDIDYTKS
jgi:hypothetical protein